MIDAMNIEAIALVLLLVLAVAGIVAALVQSLRHDGYGHRPAPRSHRSEVSGWKPYAA